ncbi:MAG: hypothetical protein WC552_10205, partial [Candidatus Omnitrophota bacterium]
MSRSEDCSTPDQYEAVFNICKRHPGERGGIVSFAVTRILNDRTPHFNRVQLIRLVETLTTKTFDKSCYPMFGWTEDEIPGEAGPYIDAGIQY